MEKDIINTKNAPAPIGPYNQGVSFGNLFFISGQIPLDPVSGDLKTANITEETKQVMANLKAVLAEADLKFSNVLKTSIFITDMTQFAEINEEYGKHFSAEKAPARETVQVAKLPKGVHVEISVIAGR